MAGRRGNSFDYCVHDRVSVRICLEHSWVCIDIMVHRGVQHVLSMMRTFMFGAASLWINSFLEVCEDQTK